MSPIALVLDALRESAKEEGLEATILGNRIRVGMGPAWEVIAVRADGLCRSAGASVQHDQRLMAWKKRAVASAAAQLAAEKRPAETPQGSRGP